MSNNKIKPVIEKRSKTIEDSDQKKVKKPTHSFYLRLTPTIHDLLQEQHKKTGLSINSIVSLCIQLQLETLPDYKIDRIDVVYTDDDGVQKQVKYSGNFLKTVSNFKKQ